MIPDPFYKKRYKSAEQRFLKPTLVRFFMQEFPRYFGKKTTENIVDEIIKIFDRLHPHKERMMPGQIFWQALNKNTRAGSKNVKFTPVILTLVNQEDVDRCAKGDKISVIARQALARMINEAYQQGGILSSRDLALLTLRGSSWVSSMRIKYEQEHQVILPHTGSVSYTHLTLPTILLV